MGFQLTMLDLVKVVSETAETEAEVVATVVHLVNSGIVQLCGNFRGARFDFDPVGMTAGGLTPPGRGSRTDRAVSRHREGWARRVLDRVRACASLAGARDPEGHMLARIPEGFAVRPWPFAHSVSPETARLIGTTTETRELDRVPFAGLGLPRSRNLGAGCGATVVVPLLDLGDPPGLPTSMCRDSPRSSGELQHRRALRQPPRRALRPGTVDVHPTA